MSLPFDPFCIQHNDLTVWIFWLLLYIASIHTFRFILELFSAKEKEY